MTASLEVQVGEKASRIADLELQVVENESKRQRTEATVEARPPPPSCSVCTVLLSSGSISWQCSKATRIVQTKHSSDQVHTVPRGSPRGTEKRAVQACLRHTSFRSESMLR